MPPMTDALPLVQALFAGLGLGLFFFGGLWWTVQKGLHSPRAAVWFIGSLFVRVSLTVLGFYWLAAGSWQKLIACLGGFILMRGLITHWRPSK